MYNVYIFYGARQFVWDEMVNKDNFLSLSSHLFKTGNGDALFWKSVLAANIWLEAEISGQTLNSPKHWQGKLIWPGLNSSVFHNFFGPSCAFLVILQLIFKSFSAICILTPISSESCQCEAKRISQARARYLSFAAVRGLQQIYRDWKGQRKT